MSAAIESLGKYLVRRQLGRGAMGTVYEGWDPIIERVVAIKTVNLPDDADEDTQDAIARFRREAQAAGRLTHPNIVGVFDYGEMPDLAYIVMEYVDGPPLKSLLDKNERFPLARIVEIMGDLLAGLQFSHDRGVVHHDIKPANLMLTKQGQGKIADFGIARIESSSMTQAGTVLGTPAYMSPEQFMGQVVDQRSDIYSSGVLLYQLLTGERPFEGSMTAIMHKALNTEPPMPSQISVTTPRAFDPVIRKAMAKRPEDRYDSASAFLTAIREAALGTPRGGESMIDDGESTMVAHPSRGGAPPAHDPKAMASSIAAAILPPASTPSGRMGAGDKKTSSKTPLFIGVGLVALLAAGGGGWWLFSPAPVIDKPPIVTPDGRTPPNAGDQALLDAEAKRKADEARLAEENARKAEELRLAQEKARQEANDKARRDAEEQARRDADAKLTAAQRAEELRKAEERARQQAEATRLAEEKAKETTRLAEEKAKREAAEKARVEEEARLVEATRQDMAAFLSRQPCSLAEGDVRDGVVRMTAVGSRAAITAIRAKISGLNLAKSPALTFKELPLAYCAWADALRPASSGFGQGNSGLSLRLEGDRTQLLKGAEILLRVTMPGFPGQLQVDYVSSDGEVRHLYPQTAEPKLRFAANPPRRLDAGQTLKLGDPAPDNDAWTAQPPFGTDLIIAVATEGGPLFESPRQVNPADPNVEQGASYLQDLKTAAEAARARGGRVLVDMVTVETKPKK